MARRTSHDRLRVFLNSRLVGLLRRETPGAISFQYDGSLLEWDSALPASLSLPLREQVYRGAPVLAVFENLLLDDDTLRRQISDRAREGTDAYSLLRAIDHDCVGALQFLPEDSEPTPLGKALSISLFFLPRRVLCPSPPTISATRGRRASR
jgi:serine/threonine-protein kinase HipA